MWNADDLGHRQYTQHTFAYRGDALLWMKPKYKGLVFTAIEDSTISLENFGSNAPDVKYSKDGVNWIQWDYSAISVPKEGNVLFKGNNGTNFSPNGTDYSRFVLTGRLHASGKVTSLVDNGTDTATEIGDYCFIKLFQGCSSLVSAPILPDVTLGEYCYYSIFQNCTSLVNVQSSLTNTNGLKGHCYFGMFNGCTSLETAPSLGNDTMDVQCYTNMFYGCTSLVTAPALPSTSLAASCYQNMFKNCTALAAAPVLPATTLVSGCYTEMFRGCSSLNYIKALFTTAPSTSYTNNWVNGVSASGTYVKSASASYTTRGVSAIPTGWTLRTA